MPLKPPPETGQTRMPLGVTIYSVADLNRDAREVLEGSLPSVWVAGEVSNLARPGSGHLYFSLKDAQAQVRCAMFRNANRSLKFPPEDGLQVLVRAKVTIYEPRGSYQLIVEHMEPAGEGILRRKLEELKIKLAAEGLFEPAHKQPLPELPRQVGIITSPTGAAVRDVLHILKRRFAAVPVIIYPVQVQGDKAKFDIVNAIQLATSRDECDVLIIGRGGGSLEDLWAFNEETVARAIFDCRIPTVSAVGHEVDFTIADLVADVRAPTPSGAAELVVPDARTWSDNLAALEKRVGNALRQLTRQHARHLQQLIARLQSRQPVFILRQHSQRLDELVQRMANTTRNRLTMDRLRFANLLDHLQTAAPTRRLKESQRDIADIFLRLERGIRQQLNQRQQGLSVLAAELQAVSPLNTLDRGYAVVQDKSTGAVIRSTRSLSENQEISTRVADGHFDAVITTVNKDKAPKRD
jgi:exodeoxyribonuclease VII large subunit